MVRVKIGKGDKEWHTRTAGIDTRDGPRPILKVILTEFAFKGYPFKNIFDLTTAGDWDCVAAVERLPALHYSVDFIFLSFGIIGFIVEL